MNNIKHHAKIVVNVPAFASHRILSPLPCAPTSIKLIPGSTCPTPFAQNIFKPDSEFTP
jgi:hypothetical protein